MEKTKKGGNRSCRVCLHTDLEDRKDIDERLAYGHSYSSITKDYPHISKWTLENHKRHMGDLKNETEVAAQLLAREIAKAKMADFNVEQFICDMRERLKLSVNKAQCLVEEYLEDIQEGIRSGDDLTPIINAHQKLLSSLESLGAIKMLVDEKAAYNKVFSDGYTISNPVEKDNSQVSFKQYQLRTKASEN